MDTQKRARENRWGGVGGFVERLELVVLLLVSKFVWCKTKLFSIYKSGGAMGMSYLFLLSPKAFSFSPDF